MILRRLVENLKQQHWTAVAIELVIVVLGVFIGLQVRTGPRRTRSSNAPTCCCSSCAAISTATKRHERECGLPASHRRLREDCDEGLRVTRVR